MTLDLTILILTYNEEQRLVDCLDSLQGVPAKVFVVDSFSTDRTLAILRERAIQFAQRKFTNYSEQRVWAQSANPFKTEWILHLDADERLTHELRNWLAHDFSREADRYDGFMFSRRTMFMGRWIRHGGHYPAYHLRLFRVSKGRCEQKAYDQHFVVDGKTLRVDRVDIVDTVAADISSFVNSHNRWSSLEAGEIAARASHGSVEARFFGSPIERRRWLKRRIFERSPLFLRSFAYFAYRYLIRLGFLDGTEGLIFHFLHALWFRFLVDAKVYEIRKRSAR